MKSSFLGLLSSLTVVAAQATVYFSPSPPTRAQDPVSNAASASSPPALSPFEANSIIANFVGLSNALFSGAVDDVLSVGKKEWSYLWNAVHPAGAEKNSIGGGTPDTIMLFVQSNRPQDFVPFSPSFSISHSPAPSTFESLMESYISTASHIFDSVVSSVLDIPHAFSSSNSDATLSYKKLLDVFDASSSEASALFLDELDGLVKLVDGKATNDRFTALRLDGLARIEAEHGQQSEVYQTASKAIQAVLSSASLKSRKLVLVVHPPSNPASTHAESPSFHLSARASPIAIHALSSNTCFSSEAACSNGTSSCSGHGSCVRVSRGAKTCYSCACGTTRDRGHKMQWAGLACEKQDVSVTFVLLVGTVVLLLATVIGSVQVLSSIGSEELPNTLVAGSSAGVKKDQ